MPYPPRDAKYGQWTSGICGWHEDATTCVEGFFCTCCQLSSQFNMMTRNKSEPDDLCTCMLLFFDLYAGPFGLLTSITACHMRHELRKRYGIEGSKLTDCLYGSFCLPCSVVQTHKEMAYRGEWAGGLCLESPPPHIAVMPMGVAGGAPYGYGYNGDRSIADNHNRNNQNRNRGGGNNQHQPQQQEMATYDHNNSYAQSPPKNFIIPSSHGTGNY